MIKLRLATADSRKQIVVEPNQTPFEILQSNEVVLEGASINLDGIPLTRQELNQPISNLVAGDSATLSVVVKTENA